MTEIHRDQADGTHPTASKPSSTAVLAWLSREEASGVSQNWPWGKLHIHTQAWDNTNSCWGDLIPLPPFAQKMQFDTSSQTEVDRNSVRSTAP